MSETTIGVSTDAVSHVDATQASHSSAEAPNTSDQAPCASQPALTPALSDDAAAAAAAQNRVLARGTQLAARYHSPSCEAARSKERFRDLERIMRYTKP